MKAVPSTPDVPLIRTDFSNDSTWTEIVDCVQKPVGDMEFLANVTMVDDTAYEGASPADLLASLQESQHAIMVICDSTTITNPRRPLLVVELSEDARQFRAEPGSIQSIENNLTIGNMGWEEFAENLDADGIFVPFD